MPPYCKASSWPDTVTTLSVEAVTLACARASASANGTPSAVRARAKLIRPPPAESGSISSACSRVTGSRVMRRFCCVSSAGRLASGTRALTGDVTIGSETFVWLS
jgi:hypothetical protein